MPTATFSEAAKVLGFKSRSTLFRLKDAGDLEQYLRPPSSTGGAPLLEMTPRNLPPLAEHVNRCIRPQSNNCERNRWPRIDPRWGTVAGLLNDALAGCGGLSLCDAEAQAIAAALPNAMAAGFGSDGLEVLRMALANLGCWRAGNSTPPRPEGPGEFWAEYGKWEPGGELDDDAFWANVGPIAGGMVGHDFEGLSGPDARELHYQLQDAISDVGRGARWDQAHWDAASARSLLDDDEVAAGKCPTCLPELRNLAGRGLLPSDLQDLADAALAAHAARVQDQQEAAALNTTAKL